MRSNWPDRDLSADGLLAALESMTDYEDIFGYRLTFGPDDHKGVDESVLTTVVDGRWGGRWRRSIRY